MSVNVTCGNCGGNLQAKAEHAGRRAKCPKCGGLLVVPGQPKAAAHSPAGLSTLGRGTSRDEPSRESTAKPTGPLDEYPLADGLSKAASSEQSAPSAGRPLAAHEALERELSALEVELRSLRHSSVQHHVVAADVARGARAMVAEAPNSLVGIPLTSRKDDRDSVNAVRAEAAQDLLNGVKDHSERNVAVLHELGQPLFERYHALCWLSDRDRKSPEFFARWGWALPLLATMAAIALLGVVFSFFWSTLAFLVACACARLLAEIWERLSERRKAMRDYPDIRAPAEGSLGVSTTYNSACVVAGLLSATFLAILLLQTGPSVAALGVLLGLLLERLAWFIERRSWLLGRRYGTNAKGFYAASSICMLVVMLAAFALAAFQKWSESAVLFILCVFLSLMGTTIPFLASGPTWQGALVFLARRGKRQGRRVPLGVTAACIGFVVIGSAVMVWIVLRSFTWNSDAAGDRLAALARDNAAWTEFADARGRFRCRIPPGCEAKQVESEDCSKVEFKIERAEICVVVRKTDQEQMHPNDLALLTEKARKESEDLGIRELTVVQSGLTQLSGHTALDICGSGLFRDSRPELRLVKCVWQDSEHAIILASPLMPFRGACELLDAFLRSYEPGPF